MKCLAVVIPEKENKRNTIPAVSLSMHRIPPQVFDFVGNTLRVGYTMCTRLTVVKEAVANNCFPS